MGGRQGEITGTPMPHQQVRRLAAARPKPSGIASVWEISYRRALRAGSKQENLRAEWTAAGVFKNSNRYPVQPLVGNSNLLERGDPKGSEVFGARGYLPCHLTWPTSLLSRSRRRWADRPALSASCDAAGVPLGEYDAAEGWRTIEGMRGGCYCAASWRVILAGQGGRNG